ncbi:hypothetical protein BDW59DRAFT_171553 [Aspergillus cavernicola]|uniref:RNA polymerase II holoenzyme cyclin-like subunit n=1 Tax=Aspergillus cavernicola TaxID=176166 RepID=A0ABR4IGW5_9EURO
MAASTIPTSGMIDPTKQAEYPIILGDRLAGKTNKPHSQLINIQYNHKTKSATAQQRSVITKSPHSRDHFNLTITDKAPPNAEQNVLTYAYQGSMDPAQSVSEAQEHNLVLVFDANKKAFVLEPVTTQLNFNLRSAPAKTQKQVIQQYSQLRTLQEDEHTSGDDRGFDQASGNDDGPADDDNPYDYRHFLPKDKDTLDDYKLGSRNATPEPYAGTSKANTPLITATKPASSPRPRPKTQANPLRQKKPTADTSRQSIAAPAKSKPRSPLRLPERQVDKTKESRKQLETEEPEEEIVFEPSKSSPSEAGTGAVSSQKSVPSPGSNIIIDGDLIIDMGSPPPARPFKVNPAHFSSNNTPANHDEDGGDEDIEDLRLPSPVPTTQRSGPTPGIRVEEEEDDDDLLAAEMEAAFEEEARSQQSQTHISSHQYVASDDESEVSEEESIYQPLLMASHPPGNRAAPAQSNPVLLASQEQWLFTDEELTRAPSQLDGMKMEQEHVNRSKGVNFITQVGIMLKLPQLTLSTAAVYFHRYFMRFSMVDIPQRPGMHPYPIAATSLFLATKVDENVRRMRELVVACCRVAQKQPNLIVDEQSKEFWKWRDTILHHEDMLLEALCFDLQLEQPYRILYDYLCFFGVSENKNLRNSAWAFVNDSMFTVLCLQFSPRIIAAAALYAAARHCDMGFEDDDVGRSWWEQIDVDLTQVRRACTRMADLYENNAANKHSQYYPTTPFLWDDGTENTRVPYSGSSLETPEVPSRKRSREPEDDSHDPQNSRPTASPKPTEASQNGRRSPKRSRVGSDAEKPRSAAASFASSATLPGGDGAQPPFPSSTSPPPSFYLHDHPPNGHHAPPLRYQHPLPPTPRTTFPPRRNSEGITFDPVQHRIDQIIQQNSTPTKHNKRIPDHRYREDDNPTRRRRSSLSSGRDDQPRPPPPDHNQPPPPPPPPEPEPEPDDEGGGSEEGEL